MDEASRMLEARFEGEMRKIVKILPKEDRQTMLFSAAQTTKFDYLARISPWLGPLHLIVNEDKEISMFEGLEHGYVLCSEDKGFFLPSALLMKTQKKNNKTIVFCSCTSVD